MAKDYSLSRQDFVQLLQDPTFGKQYAEGYLKGQALAQTVGETPMQPEVTAEAIQPEPQYIEPASTTYTGFTDQPMPDAPPQMTEITDMPPQVPKQPSVFDEMQSAKSPKEQQRLLFKLMSQSMEQQQAGVQQAEEALKKEQERQANLGVLGRLDLRPFAEALRSYGSTSVAQAQAPEMTEAQRQELMRKLQAQVQGAKEGMTKEQVLALRTMMQDKKDAQAALSQRNAMFRETKEVTSQFYKLGSAAQDYNKDANLIEGIVNQQKIPVRKLTMIVTKLGRSLGEVGAQTNTDRLSYYTPTFEAQLSNIATRFGSDGTIDMNDPSIKAIRELVAEAKAEAAEAMSNKANLYKDMMAAEGAPTAYLFQPGRAGDVGYKKIMQISGATLMGTKEKSKSAGIPLKSETAGAGGNTKSEEDKLKAELDALKR